MPVSRGDSPDQAQRASIRGMAASGEVSEPNRTLLRTAWFKVRSAIWKSASAPRSARARANEK